MKGLIIENAYFESEATRYQSGRIAAELAALGVETDTVKNDFFGGATESGKLLNAARGYAFCVYLDKDKYTARALESSGLRLFNTREAIELCDDKALTFLALAGLDIPTPKTLPGLLCYTPGAPIKEETYDYIERELGYPLVVKECYGSLGKFVYKAEGREELERLSKELQCTPHLYQKFVSGSAGRDVRAICVGGKAVSFMERRSQGDFRSNIGMGGKGSLYRADDRLVSLCERTATALGLDFCGIDVLFGKDGYLLCEVNSNAFFGGTESVTHVNVAKLYAEHIINEVKQ